MVTTIRFAGPYEGLSYYGIAKSTTRKPTNLMCGFGPLLTRQHALTSHLMAIS